MIIFINHFQFESFENSCCQVGVVDVDVKLEYLVFSNSYAEVANYELK